MVANWWPKNVLANCFVWGLIWGSRIVQQLESRRDKQLKISIKKNAHQTLCPNVKPQKKTHFNFFLHLQYLSMFTPTNLEQHASKLEKKPAGSFDRQWNITSHVLLDKHEDSSRTSCLIYFDFISICIQMRVIIYLSFRFNSQTVFLSSLLSLSLLINLQSFFQNFFNQEDDDQNFGLQKQHIILFISCCTCCISPTGLFFSSPNWFFGNLDRIWIWKSQVLDVESLFKKSPEIQTPTT